MKWKAVSSQSKTLFAVMLDTLANLRFVAF